MFGSSRGLFFAETIVLRFVALGASLGSTIWTARMLGPEKLGISTVALACATQVGLLVTLNQDAALIRAIMGASQNKVDPPRVVNGVFWLRVLGWGGASIVIGTWSMVANGANFAILGAIGIGLMFCNPPTWILQAQNRVLVQLRLVAIQQIAVLVLLATFLRSSSTAGFDLLVMGACSAAATSVMWVVSLRAIGARLRWNLGDIKTACKLYVAGRWLVAMGIAINVYSRIELLLIGWLSTIESAGQYRTALQVSGAVASATSVFPLVLYPKLVEWRKSGEAFLWAKQKAIALTIAGIAAAALAIGAPAIHILYPLVFGGDYIAAAWSAVFLVAAQLVVMINSIFAWGLVACNKEREMFAIALGVAMISLIGNIVLIPRVGMGAAAALNLISEGMILILSMWLAKPALDVPLNSYSHSSV